MPGLQQVLDPYSLPLRHLIPIPQSLRCKTKGTGTKAKHKTAALRSQPQRRGPQTVGQITNGFRTAGTRSPRRPGTRPRATRLHQLPGQALGHHLPLLPFLMLKSGDGTPSPTGRAKLTQKQTCCPEIWGSSVRRTQNSAITQSPGHRADDGWQFSSA